MAGWLDPPHDRVRLTLLERTTLDRMELEFRDAAPAEEPGGKGGRPSWWRRRNRRWCRALLRCARSVRPAMALLPIGLTLMLLGLGRSEVLAAVGAATVSLGLWASLRPRRTPRRRRWLLRRGRPRPDVPVDAVQGDVRADGSAPSTDLAAARHRGLRRRQRPAGGRNAVVQNGDGGWWI